MLLYKWHAWEIVPRLEIVPILANFMPWILDFKPVRRKKKRRGHAWYPSPRSAAPMLSTGSAFAESAVPTPSQEPFSEFAISAVEKGRALEGGSEVDNPVSRGMSKKRKIGEVTQINPTGREGEHMAKTDELSPH
jgi:hypothetical protein